MPLLRSGLFVALSMALLCRPESVARHEEPQDVIWATDVDEWAPGALRIGGKALAPLPGQKRPPCEPRAEREVSGACWEPHLERPPCPPGYFEGEGMCLKPVLAAKRPATSLGE